MALIGLEIGKLLAIVDAYQQKNELANYGLSSTLPGTWMRCAHFGQTKTSIFASSGIGTCVRQFGHTIVPTGSVVISSPSGCIGGMARL